MAHIIGKVAPRQIRALRGKVDVYYHKKYGWLARAWPKASQPCQSPLWIRTAQAMRDAWYCIKHLKPENKEAFKNMLGAGIRTWVDIAKSAALGAPDGMQKLLDPYNVTVTRIDPTHVRLEFFRNHQPPNPTDGDEIFDIRWSTHPYSAVSPASYKSTGDCKKDSQMPPQCPYDPDPSPPVPVGPTSPCAPSYAGNLLIPARNSDLYWVVSAKNRNGHYRPLTGVQKNPIPDM